MTTLSETKLTLTLTKDDITNIHNAELLTFLEEYTAQHTNEQRKELDDKECEPSLVEEDATQKGKSLHVDYDNETSETHSANCNKSVNESIDLENEIARLQTDIETFITAVDEDGRHYNICLNISGSVNVPIDESMQTDVDNKDEEEEYQLIQEYNESESYLEEQNNDEEPVQNLLEKGEESSMITRNNNDSEYAHQDKDDKEEQCSCSINNDNMSEESKVVHLPEEESELQCTERKESIQEENLRLPETRQIMPNSNRTRLEPQTNEKEESKTKLKRRKKEAQKCNSTALMQERFRRKPKYAVRSRDVLRDDEQKRVETLLAEANVSINAEIPSPYVYSNAVQSRLSEINSKLIKMQEARHYKHIHAEESHDDSLCTLHMSSVDVTLSSSVSTSNSRVSEASTRISNELGNSYLSFARQRQRRLLKLRDINEKLQRIHQEAERATMFSYTDANSNDSKEHCNNFCNVRPRWYNEEREQIATYTTLEGDNFTANEESVQKMVEKAKEEENNNTPVEGIEKKITTDPYSSLIEEVHAALNHAKVFM